MSTLNVLGVGQPVPLQLFLILLANWEPSGLVVLRHKIHDLFSAIDLPKSMPDGGKRRQTMKESGACAGHRKTRVPRRMSRLPERRQKKQSHAMNERERLTPWQESGPVTRLSEHRASAKTTNPSLINARIFPGLKPGRSGGITKGIHQDASFSQPPTDFHWLGRGLGRSDIGRWLVCQPSLRLDPYVVQWEFHSYVQRA